MGTRRSLVLFLLSVTPVALTACATEFVSGRRAEGPYCYRNSRRRPVVCTTDPTPGLATDAESKRFEPDPHALTVYVVRSSWGDNYHLVRLAVDERDNIELVPHSMARLRLAPGKHRLAFDVDGRRHPTQLAAEAGDVRYLCISGEFWVWGSSFGWASESPESIRGRALRARLVADVRIV